MQTEKCTDHFINSSWQASFELVSLASSIRHEISESGLLQRCRESSEPSRTLLGSFSLGRMLGRQPFEKSVLNNFLEALDRGYIVLGDVTSIVGFFDVPYAPTLTFEAIALKKLVRPSWLVGVPSEAVPSIELASSPGFATKSCVAIFPENLLGDTPKHGGESVFYLINRFAERTQRITLKVINEFIQNVEFSALASSSASDLTQSLSAWVAVHEHSHNTGSKPLKYFLAEKSSRSAAAVEELRADMTSILKLCEMGSIQSIRSAKLILCERAFRYGVSYDPEYNYDSISSQILVNYLQHSEGLSIAEDRITIHSNWLECIGSLASDISKIEMQSSKNDLTQNLVAFARRWGNFREGRHQSLPVFDIIRRAFSVLE